MFFKILCYVLAGLLSGVLGGMGMGGGTVLIPVLSIFFMVNQHTAQAINLIGFIPMGIIALIIHVKNGLVKFNAVMFIIIPAVLSAILFSLFAQRIDGSLLRRLFGGFLMILSAYSFIKGFKKQE